MRPLCIALLLSAPLAAAFWLAPRGSDGPSFALGTRVEFVGAENRVAQSVVNYGHIKLTDTTVRYAAPYTEHGHYESDPSSSYFTDWIIGTGGTVTAGLGDRFIVSGNFTNGSLQRVTWNTSQSDLTFSGLASHTIALAGIDAGATFTGYVQNFAWKSLRIAAGQSFILTDGNATPGAALYVDQLLLDGGLPQITSCAGNGYTIYYNPYEPANAYLAAATYPLTGGGSITPVTVQVQFTVTSVLPNGTQRLNILGAALRAHRVEFSNDLLTWSLLATVNASANGTFTFDDPAAATSPRRLYRVTYP